MSPRWIRRVSGGTAVACVLVAAAPAAADLQGFDIHGFASQGFIGADRYNYLGRSREGSFEFSEYALNFSTELGPRLRVGVQLFARDLGRLGNHRIDLDWAFGDYRVRDALGVRVGRVKMPYGLYNETADFDAVRTSVLLPQSVYDLRLRDLLVAVNGAAAYGGVEAGRAGGFDYEAYVGTVAAEPDGSVARFFADSGPVTLRRSDNDAAWGAALVWRTPLPGLRLGQTLNAYRGTMDFALDPDVLAVLGPMGAQPVETVTYDDVRFAVSSAEYTRGDLVLAAEYGTWRGNFRNPFVGTKLNWEKWYAQASYRVSALVELGVYYAVHYDDRDDREGRNVPVAFMAWQKDGALSARFDVTPSMIVKAEAHYVDGVAQLFSMENPSIAADPASLDRYWWYVTTKVSFVF